jgi:hypothetical protein
MLKELKNAFIVLPSIADLSSINCIEISKIYYLLNPIYLRLDDLF